MHQSSYSVEKMAQLFSVSRKGFYRYCQRQKQPCDRFQKDQVYTVLIRHIFKTSRETYGSDRMQKALLQQGISLSKRHILRLMKQNQCIAKKRRLFRKTTQVNPKQAAACNLLKQDFQAKKPNEKWLSDITYIKTQEGWLYVAAILDCFSRKLIGLAIEPFLNTQLVIQAFKQAVKQRGRPKHLIHHSDRGCQYTSTAFQAILKQYHIRCSMSAKGNCYDNAAMESFFASLKIECVYFQTLQNRQQAKLKILDYCYSFYNNYRIHSTLNYLIPNQVEESFFNSQILGYFFDTAQSPTKR
jgi:putative transposase